MLPNWFYWKLKSFSLPVTLASFFLQIPIWLHSWNFYPNQGTLQGKFVRSKKTNKQETSKCWFIGFVKGQASHYTLFKLHVNTSWTWRVMHTNQIMVKVTKSLIVRALACLFCIGMYVSTMLICIANAAIYSTCDTYTCCSVVLIFARWVNDHK